MDPQVILLSCGSMARHESFTGRTGGIPVFSTEVGGALTVRFSEEGSYTILPFVSQYEPGGS